MKRNVGSADRMIRALLAVTVAILYMFGELSGVAALILGVLAVVFLVTSIVGFCPLYMPFGLSTLRRSMETPHSAQK